MKIGIAITTRNRREIANLTVSQWRHYLPEGAVLVIVDDASDLPYPGAFRFDTQQGIARAKNKCIELLMLSGCTHLFLSDDDCYPVKKDWYVPYVNNSQPHLSYTFTHLKSGLQNGRIHQGNGRDYRYFELPCGCLLYLTAEVVNKIGGFDTDFIIWGYEHVEYSRRIHNAGLTEKPYMDVFDSDSLWFSADKNQSVVTSVGDRFLYIDTNKRLLDEKINDRHYKPYKA